MKQRLPFLYALIPFALTLLGGLIYQLTADPLPVLVFNADAGSLIMIAGAVLSLGALGAAWAAARAHAAGEKRLADARRERDEAHRRFLRRLDHEVKNPLTALRAALANLSSAPPEEQPAIRAELARQVDRLTRLTGDLRKLAELEERPLESLPVDLAELLTEVVQAAGEHPAHAGRDLRLSISNVPWPLPAVTGDRDLLWLAFYNLVDNALKYSRPSGSVEVRALEDGRTLTVEVADSGPGVEPEDLPRLFEELFRGANARGLEGSGLGLALSQRVIARHGGQIGVRSRQNSASGTVFSVRLPAVTKP